MAVQSVSWMAGGPQGSGVDSASNIFGKACGYGGLCVFGRREFHSNIKTMHSYYTQRVSKQPALATLSGVDLLVAFDAETVVRHIGEVNAGGAVVLDERDLYVNFLEDIATFSDEYRMQIREFTEANGVVGENVSDLTEWAKKRGVNIYAVPYLDLLREVGSRLGIEKVAALTKMVNVLAVSVSCALLKVDQDLVEQALRATFPAKIVEQNLAALQVGYEYAERNCDIANLKCRIEKQPITEQRILLTGNQAVAMGKVLGGCRVQTYYPITPAADESEYIEAHEILKTTGGTEEAVLVIQTEDEIAAINSASGACLAGARAATSTSGPGFSLMAEGLGWAGNNEVPVVVTYYQRGGPATGQPTRHSQQDLRFAMHAAHGEFARVILASGDIEEAFFDAAEIFNLAEKYQVPGIHLLDKGMANSSATYPVFDYGKVKIDRGTIVGEAELEGKQYKRFQYTQSGVSPRAFLGTKGAVMYYSGDEHNEAGNINEETVNRQKMMEKRLAKMALIEKETPLETKLHFYGDQNSENIVVGWGGPKGAIIEAIELLKEEGISCGFIQVRLVHPLPAEEIRSRLQGKKHIIDVEDNYDAQLAGVITQYAQVKPTHYVLKYTGRPMTVNEVYRALKNIISGDAAERQVLTDGA